MRLAIHLTFNGNCEEALLFYSKCFDGAITCLRKSRRLFPATGGAAKKQKVLYAEFKARHLCLIASDRTICNYPESSVNNTKLNLFFNDEAKFDHVLRYLSTTGKIHLPVHNTPDASKVAVLTDQYSISWILNLVPVPEFYTN